MVETSFFKTKKKELTKQIISNYLALQTRFAEKQTKIWQKSVNTDNLKKLEQELMLSSGNK